MNNATVGPDPMPSETMDDVGGVYVNEIIELAEGYKFDFCEFVNCEFVGRGPVEFRNCKIVVPHGFQSFGNHVHYIGCHFAFVWHLSA
jgi:hypothetical protein